MRVSDGALSARVTLPRSTTEGAPVGSANGRLPIRTEPPLDSLNVTVNAAGLSHPVTPPRSWPPPAPWGSSAARQAAVQRLTERDGNRCYYCRRDFTDDNRATIDEVVPRSKGGSRALHNQVLACEECNSVKADGSIGDLVNSPWFRGLIIRQNRTAGLYSDGLGYFHPYERVEPSLFRCPRCGQEGDRVNRLDQVPCVEPAGTLDG